MRFPNRVDIDNELERIYHGADDFEYRIFRPTAVYFDPANVDLELVLDHRGVAHLVPRIGGRTAVACEISFIPGTDEPLT
jgi:hypothetical protein